jgi:DNA-binding MarR family transcriptional regulator
MIGKMYRYRSSLVRAMVALLVSFLLIAMLPGMQAAEPDQFTDEIRVTHDPQDSYFPEIVVDSEDCSHIFWLNGTDRDIDNMNVNNGRIYYSKIDPFGTVIIDEFQLVNVTHLHGGSFYTNPPRAEVDSRDRIHIVWADNHDDTFTVYYMQIHTSGSILIRSMALTNTTNARYPDLAIGPDNTIHIVWAQWEIYEESQPYSNIYYTRLIPSGKVIVPRLAVTQTYLASNHPSIAVDPAGNAHIVFDENVNFPGFTDEIYYNILYPDGTLEYTPMQRVTFSLGQSLKPDIIVGKDGAPYLVWQDSTNGNWEIYLGSLEDPDNVRQIRLSTTKTDSESPRIRQDLDGNFYVSWSERDYRVFANSAIYYTVLDTTAQFVVSPLKLTVEGLGAKAPVMDLDSHDNPIFVWDDFRDENWDIYYMRTVIGVNLAPVDVLEASEIEIEVGETVVFYANNSTDPNGWDEVVEYNFTVSNDTFTESSGWSTNSTWEYTFEHAGEYLVWVKVRDRFGLQNPVPKWITIRVKGHPEPPGSMLDSIGGVRGAVAASAVGIGLVGTYGILSTEFGKYKFFSLLMIPLYSRIKKEKTLDNYLRGQIHGYILAKPGCHYNQIKQTLNLNNGTLAYHLRKLEKEEFIKSVRDGMYKRFYPAGLKLPKKKIRLSSMQRQILGLIAERPGISQKEIADEVGISAPAVIYHIGVLVGARLVKKEKKGARVEYRLEEEGSRDVWGAGAPAPADG